MRLLDFSLSPVPVPSIIFRMHFVVEILAWKKFSEDPAADI
jgi:hypothetical protein